MNAMTGISPGTRHLAIAIIKNGYLEHWGIKKYRNKWSEQKLAHIVRYIEKQIVHFNITEIGIKINHHNRTSPALEQLIEQIGLSAKRLNVGFKVYTIDELKYLCGNGKNKQSLIDYVIERYPEIKSNMHITSKNIKYHSKTIEAVALAHILSK